MGERKLSHSTVVSYVALIVALSTGGAYAVDKLTSHEIANNSIKSIDLKKRKGVAGSDVRRDSLTGSEIREGSLDGSEISADRWSQRRRRLRPSVHSELIASSASVDLRAVRPVMVVRDGGIYDSVSSESRVREHARSESTRRPAARGLRRRESGGTD